MDDRPRRAVVSLPAGRATRVFHYFRQGRKARLHRHRVVRLGLLLAATFAVFQAQAGELKISTWNLNWLTSRSRAEAHLPADVRVRDPEDFTLLAGYARKLDADVVGFQEVDGPQAAALVFDPARYTIVTIDQPVVQRVGLAVGRGIGIERHPDDTALDVEPGARFPLRDGLDVTLTLPGGQRLRVLVVHLKTGCQTDSLDAARPACRLLALQVPALAAWVRARAQDGGAYLVIGDFNRVLDEPEAMGTALAQAAPLLRVTQGRANPCWEGEAFIDHILVGGPARDWVVPDSLRVQVFSGGEDDKQRLSDHCPVSVRLDPGRK